MEIRCNAAGFDFTICATTGPGNSRLTVACLTFEAGHPPMMTMVEIGQFADAKRTALNELAGVLGVYPQLVEPRVILKYGTSSQRRAATAQTT